MSAAASPAGPPQPVAERLGAGIRAHQGGDVAEAERIYLGVLEDYPDDANARHLLGMLRFLCGASEAGLELLRESVRIDPKNAHAWNNLGNMYRALGHDDAAESAYVRATDLEPVASAWYNLARIYERDGKYADAVRCLKVLVRMTSGFVEALHTLASLYYRLGRPQQSREVYRQWAAEVPDDPTPRHMLAGGSSTGIPERAEDAYIVKTFDRFADSFDEQLAVLGYRAPELLAGHVIQHPLYLTGRAQVLDAGCGTGWCGPLLRSTAGRLVGVDLSPKMLAQARGRGVYDELHLAELTGFMAARAASFDIVVSADVLCYFGRLDAVLEAARKSLLPDGLLCFSVEALLAAADAGAEAADLRLGDAGRYAHSRGYLGQALAAAGFESVRIDTAVLRSECGEPVQGHIVTARAGAA